MKPEHPKWPVVERLAATSLKVERATILKWRQRGVPAKQALRLIAISKGALHPQDFVTDKAAS